VIVHTQSTSNTIWAVVPLKSPDAAKSRLRVRLDGDARRLLFFSMARHVMRTLAHTPGIAGVSVVTASPEVGAFAEREGAAVIWEERDAGTAEACRSAVAHFSTSADSLLMISGDIPLISTETVATLLSCAGTPPRPLPGRPSSERKAEIYVVIVPDRRRSGTNALLCSPPAIIPPCFGADSFARHLAAAHSQGVEVRIVESGALALDIDELEDLDELQRRLDADPTLLSPELRAALLRRAEAPAE